MFSVRSLPSSFLSYANGLTSPFVCRCVEAATTSKIVRNQSRKECNYQKRVNYQPPSHPRFPISTPDSDARWKPQHASTSHLAFLDPLSPVHRTPLSFPYKAFPPALTFPPWPEITTALFLASSVALLVASTLATASKLEGGRRSASIAVRFASQFCKTTSMSSASACRIMRSTHSSPS